MCGIFCSVHRGAAVESSESTIQLLQQRGPDHYAHVTEELDVDTSKVCVTFATSVLGLRRDSDDMPVPQPVQDAAGLLCWNGEAWNYDGDSIMGSDTKFVADLLGSARGDIEKISKIFSALRGPYAFIYYDKAHGNIYFGRDCLGRRSLLRAKTDDGSLVLCSVADMTIATEWKEVEANGIYIADISSSNSKDSNVEVTHIPFSMAKEGENPDYFLPLPWGRLNMMIPSHEEPPARLLRDSSSVTQLAGHLKRSIETRLPARHRPEHPPVAILFSGGLDCSLIARLAHECLQPNVQIDLINVAFENPRIHKNLTESSSAYETCPDRITARHSLSELQKACAGRNFILRCIDVPYTDTLKYKEEVRALIYPHDTEMDVSIALALFFAARGSTESRVLFSGLGADELFGGYQRHALALKRGGYQGLLEELQLDISRLGKRNLGRDDRVISRWGKEVRYPYLDENIVSWAMAAPVWNKVGFGFSTSMNSDDVDDDRLDDKLVLRCIAESLGIHGIAKEKKRAIQFGSRSAKMESGRTRGTEKVA